MGKLRKWKKGKEAKDLRVNAGKTKVMQCRVGRFQSEYSGKYPCDVCRKGVASNSIRCVECLRWVHKRCSGILGKLKSNTDFHYKRCLEGENGLFQSDLLKEVVIEPNVKLECVPKFCYFGDTLGAGESVEEATRARVRCVWAMFKELSPFLTARDASYRIKGKIYKACVQSVLTYGTETWAMKVANSVVSVIRYISVSISIPLLPNSVSITVLACISVSITVIVNGFDLFQLTGIFRFRYLKQHFVTD